jgi:very-short-patch-repair endonuclease
VSAGEQRAWTVLRALKPEGIHVVRQHQIGRYRVDFAIRKARVAIEIDGAVHDFPGRPELDAQRQRYIENMGWKVVRLRSEVTQDSKTIIDAVKAALPLPLRGGGRGSGDALVLKSEAPPTVDDSASPCPLTPSPQGEGEFEPRLRRRTRADRKLQPRRAS